MVEPKVQPARKPRVRQTPADRSHADLKKLIITIERLVCALEPLVEHVPVLVEVAKTVAAGKTAGRAISRTARFSASTARWLSSFAIAIAVLWAVWTHKWESLLGVHTH